MSYDSLYNPTLGSTSTLPSAKSHSTTSSASSTTPKITPYNSNFDLSILNSLPNKKRFFPVKVEVHPRDCAVILHFAVQTEKEVAPLFCQKILNLHPYITSLQVSAASILNELTTKYKFLDRIVKLSQLENAILQLQQRPISSIPESSSRKSRSSAIYTAFSIPKRAPSEEVLIRRVLSPSKDLDDENEVASIEMIDEYIELLYENLPEKLKSAKLILSLALRQELLPTLVHNVSLFSAMSRTLREDTKKNLDLMATLITFFHQFVKHPLYLPYLTEHKLGDLCMKLLDQELKRKEIWDREPPSIHLQQKQDVVIYHCVSMLYHMAKEIYLQVKMSHRQLAALLCEWMKPSSIVLPFLTLLSQYYENKEQLKWIKEPLVPKLIPLLHQPCTLVDSLKLLINLSHDRTWQEEMISAGLVVVLVDLFESSDPVPIELELLMYQLSTDDRTKSIFSYTPIMSLILKKVSKHSKSKEVSISLLALAINLSFHINHAEKVVQEQGIPILVKRFLKTQEYLMVKWIRTLSIHPITHSSLLPYVEPMMTRYSQLPEDHQVELLGLLSVLPIPAKCQNLLQYDPKGGMDYQLAWVCYEGNHPDLSTSWSMTPSPSLWCIEDEEIQYQLSRMPMTEDWIQWALSLTPPLASSLYNKLWCRLDTVDDPRIHLVRFQRYNAEWLEKVKGTGSGGSGL